MAKHNRSIRGVAVGNNRAVEHIESHDDNLLPDADQLDKYKAVDPNIIPWLMELTASEVKFRREFMNRQLTAVDNANIRHHTTSRMAIIVVFLIFLATAGASFVLLYFDKSMSGGLLSGCASALMALVLLATGIYSKRNPTTLKDKDNNQS